MYLCMRYFVWDGNKNDFEFRRSLTWDLINNPKILTEEESLRRSKRATMDHAILVAQKHMKC
jgi:hypothetical protein